MRYVLDVRYRGTRYSGWQVQKNAHTVQAELDQALSLILKQPVATMGAGRTDAGVHAMQLPAHFDLEEPLHPAFLKAVNAVLPDDVAITKAYEALTDDFHARFTATHRAYQYKIIFQKDPFGYQRSWWCKEKVELEPMLRGAEIIKEYNSFESFCKARGNNKTFFCDIMESKWEIQEEAWIYHVKANRFLRGMVRTIVGTLFLMGKGKLDEAGLRRILEGKDRKLAGPSAIADGLFLTEVGYPPGHLKVLEFPR